MIPKVLSRKDFGFVLLGKWNLWKNSNTKEVKQFPPEEYEKLDKEKVWKPLGKAPFEKGWEENPYKFDDINLQKHLEQDRNYGIIGGVGNLRILDIDNKDFVDGFKEMFKDTFMVQTGSGGLHIYIITEYDTNHVLKDGIGEFRANKYQVVGPNSTHPNGNKYISLNNNLILRFEKEMIESFLKPYLKDSEPTSNKKVCGDESRSGVEYRKAISEFKKGKSREEVTKVLMAYKKFADGSSQYQNLTLDKAENYILEQKEKGTSTLLTRRGQIEEFWKSQPFFYDKAKMFWLWDLEKYRWILSDEVDFLNSIQEKLGVETINSKAKAEFIEGFKQIGRKKSPKEPKETWIQFGGKIYDILTEEIIDASPEYFITNPIPYKVGESEETPEIDKLFSEWVGEENKQQLYELIAYSLSTNQFMQRLFSLCGGGANGKGTYTKLLYKFLGEENCVSSEIQALSESRFEVSVLYKKLLAVAGEVSHSDLKNTNILKKISGEDKLSFEFKGKNSFTADNTATFICLTNSLPTTPDKSLGFYRRWMIIDFPNQFSGINTDIIGKIPKEEFNNLACKSLKILKQLYKTKIFTNEGDFERREEKYEEHSNPVMKFIESHCEEHESGKISLREFTNRCNDYLKEKHLRVLTAIQIGKVLRNEGFEIGKRKDGETSGTYVLNILFNHSKTTRTTQTTQS